MNKNFTRLSFAILIALTQFISINSKAQTVLSTGDVVITGFDQINRYFQFVSFKDLAPNTVIKFTDAGFQINAATTHSGTWRTDKILTWTNSTTSTIPAGTLITMNNLGNSTSGSASIGTIAFIANSCNCGGYSSSGLPLIRLLIYQGGTAAGSTSTDFSNNTVTATLATAATPIFMYCSQGSAGGTTWITSGPVGGNFEYLPTDMTNDNVYLSNHTTNAYYNGPRAGLTAAQYLANVSDTSKWLTDATYQTTNTLYPYTAWSTTNFSFGTAPSFTGTTTLNACKNTANSINSNLAITDAATVGSATETWSITTNPTNGTLSGFPTSSSSTGGAVTPTGLTYTPNAGYTGSDAFTIQVSNGSNTASQTVTVTVNPLPFAGVVTTTQDSFCATAGSTYQTTGTGGVWSTSDINVAYLQSATNTSVNVFGANARQTSAGTARITYTVTTTYCGIDSAFRNAYIRRFSDTGTITPSVATICVGDQVTFSSNSVTDGIPRYGGVRYGHTWTTQNSSIASVNSSSGVATGVSPGTAYIRYTTAPNGCGSFHSQRNVTVVARPIAGSISGTTTFCPTQISALSISGNSTTGTWSSTNPSVATVNSSGSVTGVAVGTTYIKYSVTNGICTDSTNTLVTINTTHTVTASAGTNGTISNSGSNAVCHGTNSPSFTITPNSGYVIQSVLVDGVNQGAITSFTFNSVTADHTISATFTPSCTPPTAGSLSGTAPSCPSTSSTLSISGNSATGTWSSSNTNVATVNQSGSVSGVAAGTTYITYTVTNGCGTDSAHTLVTIHQPATNTITTSICAGSSFTVGTQTFNTTGNFTITLSGAAANGCDSVVTLNLTIKQPATKSITTSICAGSSFTIGQITHNTTGQFIDTLRNAAANSCDSIVTLNLTIKQPVTNTITTSICSGSSYIVGTQTFNTTSNNTITLAGAAANGCDSIVTLNLTIKQPATNTITTSICAGFSYTVGTQTFNTTSNNTITLSGAAVNGCDSIVTLNLTVKQPATNVITTSICAGSTYIVGTHVHSTNGQFIDTLHNAAANGCDSIVTLNLTVNQPVTNVINTSICTGQSYTVGTQSFNSNGQYFVTFPNGAANGCDSTVVLNLTVNPNPTPSISGVSSICSGTSGTIDAGAGYSSYAWSTGASSQTISVSSANSYTVTVSNSFGCTATASKTITVTTTVVPSVTISQDINGSLCPGTNVTFTATPVNGGTSPSYQWLKNGNNVGSNSATYSDNALVNGDVIAAVMTSNNTCASPTTATSNSLTQVVYHPVLTNTGGGCVTDNLIVNNAANASQIVWEKNGAIVTSSSSHVTSTVFAGNNGAGTGLNQLNAEYGIFRTVTGDVYVADRNNHRIIKFANGSTQASTGVVVAGGNGQGNAANQLYYPTSVILDGSGNLYVCDQFNHRIQKFPAGSTSASNGVTVAGVSGSYGSTNTKLFNPNTICFDAGGNLYVSDNGNNRVQKFAFGSSIGTTVAGGNGAGVGANQLNSPTGIVVDASGNLFVSDQKNNRVQKFPSGSTSATNGATVAGGNGQGITANKLNYPAGLFIDGSNNLYVADWNNYRVQQFPSGSTSATNGVTIAGNATSGAALTQMRRPQGVAVDAFGTVYVSDQDNNRISVWGAAAPDTTYHPGAAAIYNAVVTFAGGCVLTTNPDTVKPMVSPYISFIYNRTQAKVCTGTNITFAATTVNGGTAPHYQWKVNSHNVGTDSIGYTYVPVNNDTVTCLLTSNAVCTISPTAVSGKSIVTVYSTPCPNGVPGLQAGSYKIADQTSEATFSIYPNPATSVLNCQIATDGDLKIVNGIGQVVVEQHLTNQSTQININHLASGVYLYTFQSEGIVFRGKVVKE